MPLSHEFTQPLCENNRRRSSVLMMIEYEIVISQLSLPIFRNIFTALPTSVFYTFLSALVTRWTSGRDWRTRKFHHVEIHWQKCFGMHIDIGWFSLIIEIGFMKNHNTHKHDWIEIKGKIRCPFIKEMLSVRYPASRPCLANRDKKSQPRQTLLQQNIDKRSTHRLASLIKHWFRER